MAETFQPGIIRTVNSQAATGEKLFIKGNGAVCGAGEKAAGVSMHSVDAANKALGIMVTGVFIVLAGASVSAGNEVESDANGKAIPLSTGKSNGVSFNDASADEDLVIVIR